MFNLFKKKKVILREERSTGDYRFLGAEIKKDGNLVFEGQDLGSGVESAFGCSEYEWYWTVKKQDIPKFKEAIGGNGNILKLLGENFSGKKAANLYEFMQNNNIPFESWSRIGN